MKRMERRSMVAPLLGAFLVLGLGAGCGGHEEHDGHAEGAEHEAGHGHAGGHGPGGGALLAIEGADRSVEVVHHAGEGALELRFLAADGRTPAELAGPVKLNLQTGQGPVQVAAEKAAGEKGRFTARHPALAGGCPAGQITFTLEGRDYFLPLPHHDHGEGEHEHEHD
jgi:hypothetical protein